MGIIAGIAIPTTIAVINRQKKNAAVKSAENVFTAAKELLLEAQSTGDVEGVTAGGDGDSFTYKTTAAAMVSSGDLEKNPVDANGSLTITINSSNKFQVVESNVTINKVVVYAIKDTDGNFVKFSTTNAS